jgi:hypothetical protein
VASRRGDLSVKIEGAIADLLLIDGNPLENTKIVADPDRNFLVSALFYGRFDRDVSTFP